MGRGLDAYANGLIRQCFTKGKRFENITGKDVGGVMEKLSHRPRKTLDYLCPVGTKHPIRSFLLVRSKGRMITRIALRG